MTGNFLLNNIWPFHRSIRLHMWHPLNNNFQCPFNITIISPSGVLKIFCPTDSKFLNLSSNYTFHVFFLPCFHFLTFWITECSRFKNIRMTLQPTIISFHQAPHFKVNSSYPQIIILQTSRVGCLVKKVRCNSNDIRRCCFQ